MSALAVIADIGSAVTALLALAAGIAVLVATRRPGTAMPVLLDLLLAAGLLRLAADPTYPRAATAGAVLLLRQLLTWGVGGAGSHVPVTAHGFGDTHRLSAAARSALGAVSRPAWRARSER